MDDYKAPLDSDWLNDFSLPRTLVPPPKKAEVPSNGGIDVNQVVFTSGIGDQQPRLAPMMVHRGCGRINLNNNGFRRTMGKDNVLTTKAVPSYTIVAYPGCRSDGGAALSTMVLTSEKPEELIIDNINEDNIRQMLSNLKKQNDLF